MSTKAKLHQPLLSVQLANAVTEYSSITSPARMDIYAFHLDAKEDHDLSFIPSPYCEWIIGYNENPDEAVFCCIGSVSKLTTIALPHFTHYLGIRFDDDICYVNKNASEKASSAGMRDQHFEYAPSPDSYEYALIDGLSSAKSFPDQIKAIQKFLEDSKRLCYIQETTNDMFLRIKESCGSLSVSELSAQSGYSERHINRMITSQFGFGPKDYCKYLRFQKVLAEIYANPLRGNSEFILNIGYSDQAHFQREFKLFLGITPKQFIHML